MLLICLDLKKLRSLLFSFACLLALPALGREPQGFLGALDLSYANSDELRSASEALRSAQINKGIQELYWVPSFAVKANLKNQEEKSSKDGSRSMTGFQGTREIGLESILFKSGQFFNISATDKQLLLSKLALDLTREKIFFDMLKAYVGVITQTRAVELSLNNLELIKKEKDAQVIRREAGIISAQDVLLSESYVSEAMMKLSASRSLLKQYRMEYKDLVGQTPEGLSSGISELSPENLLEGIVMPRDLVGPVEAFEKHDKTYKIEYLSRAIEVDKVKVKAYDNVTVTGGIYRTKLITNQDMPEDDKNGYYIGVSALFKLPLIQPLVIGSVDAFAQSRDSKTIFNRTELRRDFEVALEKLSEQKTQIKYLRELVLTQEMYIEALRERIGAGIQSSKDYLEGVSNLLKARVNLLKARMGRLLNLYKIVFSTNYVDLQSDLRTAYGN